MKKLTRKKAFTIVELIIVIAVIGVLAAILIPTFSNIIEKANYKSALSDARNALTGFMLSNLEQTNGNSQVKHVVILVEQARKTYIFGWGGELEEDNTGRLLECVFSPFDGDATSCVNQLNCSLDDVNTGNTDGKAFCLMLSGYKSHELNEQFENVIDVFDDLDESDLPKSTLMFDGFLLADAIKGNEPGAKTYSVKLNVYDAFNDVFMQEKVVNIPVSPEQTSFTLNDSNFGTYISGAKPYNTTDCFSATFSQEFTLSEEGITPAELDVEVYPFETVGGQEFVLLKTVTGLQAINDSMDSLDKNYMMNNDIDCHEVNYWVPGWQADDDYPFNGIFEGNNKTVIDLVINRP
ncbi:MAG: type II secretion system protein, partial [Clostridiales bacterium]|nr:type II secretion system protein [Clostridiales bacterium]